jgi:hypothetical protein
MRPYETRRYEPRRSETGPYERHPYGTNRWERNRYETRRHEMRRHETRRYQTRRPFWDRKTVPAGVLLFVVIALLTWLLATRAGGTHHEGAPPTQRSPARSVAERSARTTPGVAGLGSGCYVPSGSQAVPEYAPQGITWQLYQTVALPYSNAAGPLIVSGGVARCYAHDPLGALLAVSQIPYRYLISPDWRQVVQRQVIPGTGEQSYVPERSQASNDGGNQPGDYNQLAGFQFVTYSPAVAVIEIASANDSGGLQAGPVTVDWSDGDWKLQLQPDGSSSPQELPISSLVGFASWSGV